MRIFRRISIVLLLAGGSGGCGDETNSGKTRSPAMPAVVGGPFPAPGQSGAQAPYGLMVDLSYPGDPAALGADARVYVFLRKEGERMPLALQYFAAAELPRRVSLTVAEPLSNVELIARLSFSGRVERSAEDVEVSQLLNSVGHPPETLVLRLQEGAATPSRSVTVRVRVSAEGADEFPSDATVFVVARSRTNPMPLAVKKLVLKDLPTEIELSDADAMMFSHRLSTVAAFTLSARISRTGDAVRSAEDFESPSVTVDAAAIPDLVTLAISTPE